MMMRSQSKIFQTSSLNHPNRPPIKKAFRPLTIASTATNKRHLANPKLNPIYTWSNLSFQKNQLRTLASDIELIFENESNVLRFARCILYLHLLHPFNVILRLTFLKTISKMIRTFWCTESNFGFWLLKRKMRDFAWPFFFLRTLSL